ncbi:hypothetical protein LSH36_100g12065 [Paralvinella palmiformis]|uniref:U3 small nucleolar RNA-interacting protein 2 n=1 Tax=Paralvinella palmiformis TaxID=53620 RepID=A0AAD9N9Z9_9ANNE|nr:hypothetical protein LSH36_100g12065 [Paralvinella palmiformis]
MSFFIRKRNKNSAPTKTKSRSSKTSVPGNSQKINTSKLVGSEDEEILSDSDVELGDDVNKRKLADVTSSEDDEETAQEKRLRLAKKYLSQLEEETELGDDDVTGGTVSDRLKEAILEQSGKLRKSVASTYQPPSTDHIRICNGHKLSVTCAVITPDDKFVFTGSKDCTIIKWSVSDGKRLHVIPRLPKETADKNLGHSSHILCLAITTDNKLLASGDKNKLILLWNPSNCQLLHTFTGHRDAISGLSFRRGTHQLFSASLDRSVKIWNADEMAYVETLFGHQDVITGIDSLTRERAVTSGGRDGSIRIWKVIEESQLVFHGHSGSIDCVSLIDEEHFVSGADDNSLAIWSVMKKKPITLVPSAHSGKPDGQKDSENWISSIATLVHTDFLASGSKDGSVRFWECSNNFKNLSQLFSVPVPGFINCLKFSSNGNFLIAAVGQEHRMGRWWHLKQAKNCLYIIRLNKSSG